MIKVRLHLPCDNCKNMITEDWEATNTSVSDTTADLIYHTLMGAETEVIFRGAPERAPKAYCSIHCFREAELPETL